MNQALPDTTPAPAAPLLKDGFSVLTVESIANAVHMAWPALDRQRFIADATREFAPLSLMTRVQQVAQTLHAHLPARFDEALAIVEATLGPAPAEAQHGEGIGAFARAPYLAFVGVAGLSHPEVALGGLRRLTKHFTAEFALRPFLAHRTDTTFAHVAAWVGDGDPRVRRLASEGTRPLLPWGKQVPALKQSPERALALIEPLADDCDTVVRRSAANHLNDVSRLDAALALSHASAWGRNASPRAQGTVRHALRNLIKAGIPQALAMVGYDVASPLVLEHFALSQPQVQIGGDQTLHVRLMNPHGTAVTACVDFAIEYASARGTLRAKVFKGCTLELAAGERTDLSFKRDFQVRTTRALYAGRHVAEVRVNGQSLGKLGFELV